MKKTLLTISTIIVLAAGGLVVWHELLPGLSFGDAHAATDTELYTCGMHPEVIQEGPGSCPICKMDLVPLASKGSKHHDHGSAPSSPGVVMVDPVMVQNMGVRVAAVTRGAVINEVRAYGTVEVPEDSLSVVNLRYSGWIETLWADETGMEVAKGDKLFSIYSPEVTSAEEEYLSAVALYGTKHKLTRASKKRLELLGISPWYIKQIAQKKKTFDTITVTAPADGYILDKHVLKGAHVKAGQDLLEIGRLDEVWIQTSLYEHDAPWVTVGSPATVELSFDEGGTRGGTVSYLYPTLNKKSKTVVARIVVDNEDGSLKPGMAALVTIATEPKSDALVVPSEALIMTGTRTIVFTSPEVGKYVAVEVTPGFTGDNGVTEILDGLEEGQTVVTSGQFLLDSESKIQEATAKLLTKKLQAKTASGGEVTYYTCPMHPEIVETEPGTCPICKMDLVPQTAASPSISGPPAAAQGMAMPASSTEGVDDPYVCPMCPEILHDGPGSCPKCKMDLVPASSLHDDGGKKPSPMEPGKSTAPPAVEDPYVCPMCPEILHDGPGSCPKCKMDLVPASSLGMSGAH